MADVTEVGSDDAFVESIIANDDLNISENGASELWRVWTHRYENGAKDDVLVALPGWFADDEFGRNRPYFFAKIEHDDPDKGAVLFKDIRLIDINIVENQIWDDVTMSETLDVFDISDDNEYIDEAGKDWIPRSLMTIYKMSDGDSNVTSTTGPAGSLTDVASDIE